MSKFFVDECDVHEEKVYIKNENVNHITNVLRLNLRSTNTSSRKGKWRFIWM